MTAKSYTYTGDQKSLTLRGIEFVKGKAVKVDDASLQAKLDGLPYFEEAKPKPKAKPKAKAAD